MSRAAPTVEAALALALHDGRVLVARRAAGGHLPGLWEFPGGKLEDGELPVDAAKRELAEETGLAATELEPLAVCVHEYADRTVRLHAFLVRASTGEVEIDGDREWRWATRDELETLEMPEANRQILAALRWR